MVHERIPIISEKRFVQQYVVGFVIVHYASLTITKHFE